MLKTRIIKKGMLIKKVSYFDPEYKQLVGDKAIKKNTIETLKITTNSGKIFYADPSSRQDISEAISIASDLDIEETNWKLAEEFEGKRIVSVSVEELKEVLFKALKIKAGLVGVS